MSKNSKANRQRKIEKKRSQRQTPSKGRTGQRNHSIGPSALTLWRTMHLDYRLEETVSEALRVLQPDVWQRDGQAVQRIEQAPDIEAVLDLTPGAMGLADVAWSKRMRGFGPDAANPIAARINSDWMRAHAKDRTGIQERWVSALRWCDDRGVDALMSCWDAFDDYGRSLASIVLGFLGAHQSADRIWACYQETRSSSENLFVGALWGLIDLGDQRAADALVELLVKYRVFYEKFGFLSRAGDERVLVPVLREVISGREEVRSDAMWALTGIAHRMGRDVFQQVLLGSPDAQESHSSRIESLVDLVFRYSQEDVEQHFEMFYSKDAGSLLSAAKYQDLIS